METIITHSASETQELGEQFARKILSNFARPRLGASILCLYGELGSGKTTFVQGLARGLGIKRRIISPTFVIVRQYVILTLNEVKGKDLDSSSTTQNDQKNFYHIDLYRCETEKDIQAIGIKEILEDPENVIAIEWPEKLGTLLPDKRTDIMFQYLNEEERKIEIT